MRALCKTTAGPGLVMTDVPEPSPGPGEAKVRILRAGLCGTDLHLHDWDDWAAETVKPPLILGHELFGVVTEVASDVQSITPGQHVSIEGHLVCGSCRSCRAGRRHLCINTLGVGVNRDGGFADYVCVPAGNLWVQPDDMDPDLGALFDPLGNATHTALSFPIAGEDVVVTGAGPIGVMAVAVARHVGARYVVATDVSEYRLALAKAAGADLVLNAREHDLGEAMRSLGMKEGFDIALEMSGAPAAVTDMLSHMNHGGRVAMLGLPSAAYEVNWGRVITHMITLKGVYGREMFETWYAMSAMLHTSAKLREAVTSVVTHRFDAMDWADAFETARSGQCGKVLLDWSKE